MSKPKCKLIGENGNIFNLLGIASEVLKQAGLYDQDKDMQDKVLASSNYDEALQTIMKYVDVE